MIASPIRTSSLQDLLIATIFTVSLSYSQVVINELMYNPSYSGGSSDDGEYVELFNAGQSAVDLSGYKLSDAIDFTFPSGATIAAGSDTWLQCVLFSDGEQDSYSMQGNLGCLHIIE